MVKQIEGALSALVTALVKAKGDPANSTLSLGELKADVNSLTILLGIAKSAPDGSVSFQECAKMVPRVAYWMPHGMFEIERVQTIFYADSQPFLNKIISAFLIHRGYEVEATNTPEDAVARIKLGKHELVILDNGLPGIGWMGLVSALRRCDYPGKILLLTSEFEDAGRSVYHKLNVDRILDKPIGCSGLLRAIIETTTHAPRNVPRVRSLSRMQNPHEKRQYARWREAA